MRMRIDPMRRFAPIAVAAALLIVPSLAMAQMMDTNSEVYQLDEWQGMHGAISSFSEAPMLAGMVAAPSGSRIFRDEVSGTRAEAVSLGIRLAERLLDEGAGAVLREARL